MIVIANGKTSEGAVGRRVKGTAAVHSNGGNPFTIFAVSQPSVEDRKYTQGSIHSDHKKGVVWLWARKIADCVARCASSVLAPHQPAHTDRIRAIRSPLAFRLGTRGLPPGLVALGNVVTHGSCTVLCVATREIERGHVERLHHLEAAAIRPCCHHDRPPLGGVEMPS
jgi:hypothetical protein